MLSSECIRVSLEIFVRVVDSVVFTLMLTHIPLLEKVRPTTQCLSEALSRPQVIVVESLLHRH